VALLDLSTGEFQVTEHAGVAARQALDDEVRVLRPREILAPAGLDVASVLPSVAETRVTVTPVDGWTFDPARAAALLCEQLQVAGLQGFGLDDKPAAVAAAGGLLRYLRDTQKTDLAHVRTVRLRETADRLLIDPTTLAHLEVVESAHGGRGGSLLDEVDRTVTPMGGRLVRAWLIAPLIALDRIRERLDAVEELAFRAADRGKVRDTLSIVVDIERLISKIALSTASPRDLVALARSLGAVPRVRLLLGECRAPLLAQLVTGLDDLREVRNVIEATLADEPPLLARDGDAIRDGVDAELDELRRISRSGKQVIAELEASERARTGVQSLKVRFNRVFGYYIEVSKANLHAVPADYLRKQTIAGGERFVTPALKDYEEKVLGADERALERELELFEALRRQVAAEAARVIETARAIAAVDVLAGLAETAAFGNYTKPHVHDGDELSAVDVRHPVVERLAGGTFVPNDVTLNGTTHQLVVLTGPNMGGKSTYLRQVALMSLLAQAGAFVPAREAKLSLVDRIYARVGAADNIARGQSTFMVEMQETALILNGATSRSLVVLDEVGRGTATFDGLSIAWAVAEHLATSHRARPKTLFATHYHELTDLADGVPGVINAHVAVQEWKDDIVFLHKIKPGRSDRSYGIHVARLAGLPGSVVARAREILGSLEKDELARGGRPSISGAPAVVQQQLGLFQTAGDDALRERLRAIDVDSTTPLDALRLLAELKREATD
jgi:DNA mismatch repair protein MutS